MACFEDTIPHLIRNAFFFAAKKPHKMLLACVLVVVPAVVTVLDIRYRPLYGFLWTVCGFGLIAMMISELLIKDLEQYLPEKDTADDNYPDEPKGQTQNMNQRKTLREMKRLDQ